eukprot:Pgem_evm1s16647
MYGLNKNIKIQSFGSTNVNLKLGRFSTNCDVELCDIDDCVIILGRYLFIWYTPTLLATIANYVIEIKNVDTELQKFKFHRQNFVHFQYYDIIDKQLEKWLDEKVGIPNNEFTPVHNPLLAAPQYNNDPF